MEILATGKKHNSWNRALHALAPEDIWALNKGDINKMEGTRQVSWIWRIHRHTTDEQEMNEGTLPVSLGSVLIDYATALRIEWCKACACAHCWDEEVTLTLTEMEHTLLFFAAKQEQWMQRAQCIGISPGESTYTL